MHDSLQKKVALIILDGFGLGKNDETDAIFAAHKPFFETLWEKYPHTTLKTFGNAVGLPEFQTGGSEVGHITIGAGRPVKHLLTKINDQIENGEFFENPKLKNVMEKAKKKGKIHFLGMCSDGGIHSFQPHLYGLLSMAENFGIEKIFVHCLLDGRDVGERTAKEFLAEIEQKKIGKIASLSGRFFGMDRDNNWDRTEKEMACLTDKNFAVAEKNPQEILDDWYASTTESDYYVEPQLFDRDGQLENDDILVFFNYRSDRARQIVSALLDKNFESFKNFERKTVLQDENVGIFGPYSDTAQQIFDFGEEKIANTLGEVLEKNGKTQLRISETEKFNHVTFFFSGEKKAEFVGERRILVASPKCKSFAEKPEMAAYEQTEKLLEILAEKDFDFIAQNFANADLVGHSGDFEATKKAVEVLDDCLSREIPALLLHGYEILVTADHGNADFMRNFDGSPNASHTKNPVPLLWISENSVGKKLQENGDLADIAPTILHLLGLSIPCEMTGKNLGEI